MKRDINYDFLVSVHHPETSDESETGKLASAIYQDIRERALTAGERYLNGAEIAEKYGVTLITANRALQSLAARKILERRRKAGTFISGSYGQPSGEAALKCIHLLMPVTYYRFSRQSVEQALFGLHTELPDVNIQHTFLPASGEIAFARDLVDKASSSNAIEGVVLFVSSAELQQFFREAGVPTVVFGSVFPETSELPWVDRDQHQIGKTLAEFLIQEKHTRVTFLMRDRWGYGDNLLLDGAQEVFGSVQPNIATRIRSVPALDEVALGSIKSVLKAADAPTALICRSEKLAKAAATAALELGISVPKQLRIVVAETSLIYPCTVPTMSQEEQGVILGRMLKQLSTGKTPDPHNVLIPVKFHNPLAS